MQPNLARLLTIALLATAAASTAGCGPTRQELIVSWTFAGKTCTQAGVSSVVVQIANEVLTPDTFQCSPAPGQETTGADLGSFLRGDYVITLSGFDAQGRLAYQLQQPIRVGGAGPESRFSFDLPAVQETAITLLWTFAGKTCAQAGNPILRVTLDGQPLTDVNNNPDIPCAQTASDNTVQDGTSIFPLAPGQHTFSLTGYLGGQPAYSLSGFTVTAVASQNVTATPDLAPVHPTSASASLGWTFGGLSCADAQVGTVRVFVDAQAGVDIACSTGGIDGAVVSPLVEGSHTFKIVGSRSQAASDFTVYESGVATATGFFVGNSKFVAIDAAPSAPAIGNATLAFTFPAGGPSCTGSAATAIGYTLTPPGGPAQAEQQVACGGGAGHTALVLCSSNAYPGATCPPGALPGLAPGLWTISARTLNVSGPVYRVSGAFPVANETQSLYTLTFQ